MCPQRSDPQFQGMAAVDNEGFALVKAADVVGVDDVAVPGSLATKTRVVKRVGLLSPLQDPLGSGQRGRLVGLLELVGDDRPDGAGEAVADRVVGAEAGPGLGDEDDGDVAPGPCAGIKLPRMVRRDAVILTAGQVDDLAEAASPYGALVYLLAYGGLRWGEAARPSGA